MSHTRVLHAVVVTCLCGVALVARVVDAAAPSALQLDPTLLWAQTPSSPSPADTRATGGAASAEDLAKQLSNPIASLISVPFQSNFDFNAGPDTVVAPHALSSGPATVTLDVAYDGGGVGKGGKATLSVNGQAVAEGRVEKTQPNIFSADETADVGIDNQTPVAEGIGIGPETRFTGKINQITLEVRQ